MFFLLLTEFLGALLHYEPKASASLLHSLLGSLPIYTELICNYIKFKNNLYSFTGHIQVINSYKWLVLAILYNIECFHPHRAFDQTLLL